MKKPRLNDFDPKATPTLSSPMDDMPIIEKPSKRAAKAIVVPVEASKLGKSIGMTAQQLSEQLVQEKEDQKPSVRTPVRPYARTGIKRTITRYAFEFYQDQIETIRKFSLEEKAHGEKGSMSEMVREAVDMYIAKKNNIDK